MSDWENAGRKEPEDRKSRRNDLDGAFWSGFLTGVLGLVVLQALWNLGAWLLS